MDERSGVAPPGRSAFTKCRIAWFLRSRIGKNQTQSRFAFAAGLRRCDLVAGLLDRLRRNACNSASSIRRQRRRLPTPMSMAGKSPATFSLRIWSIEQPRKSAACGMESSFSVTIGFSQKKALTVCWSEPILRRFNRVQSARIVVQQVATKCNKTATTISVARCRFAANARVARTRYPPPSPTEGEYFWRCQESCKP